MKIHDFSGASSILNNFKMSRYIMDILGVHCNINQQNQGYIVSYAVS